MRRKKPAFLEECWPQSELLFRLESEANSHFTPGRAGNGRAAWIDKSGRMTKRGRAGDVVVEVVAVVGAVRQFERLRHQLHIHVTLSGIVELPKGFQLAPIMQFGSARPYNLTNSSNTLNTGGGTATAVVVPNNNLTNWFAFAGNNTGAQNCFYGLNGVTPSCTIAKYDPLRGDPFYELDMRLAKNIKICERMHDSAQSHVMALVVG